MANKLKLSQFQRNQLLHYHSRIFNILGELTFSYFPNWPLDEKREDISKRILANYFRSLETKALIIVTLANLSQQKEAESVSKDN